MVQGAVVTLSGLFRSAENHTHNCFRGLVVSLRLDSGSGLDQSVIDLSLSTTQRGFWIPDYTTFFKISLGSWVGTFQVAKHLAIARSSFKSKLESKTGKTSANESGENDRRRSSGFVTRRSASALYKRKLPNHQPDGDEANGNQRVNAFKRHGSVLTELPKNIPSMGKLQNHPCMFVIDLMLH